MMLIIAAAIAVASAATVMCWGGRRPFGGDDIAAATVCACASPIATEGYEQIQDESNTLDILIWTIKKVKC